MCDQLPKAVHQSDVGQSAHPWGQCDPPAQADGLKPMILASHGGISRASSGCRRPLMDPELLVLELNLHAQESHRWAIRGHPVWCSNLPLLFHSGAKSLKHLLLTNGQDVVHIGDEKTNGLTISHRRFGFSSSGKLAGLCRGLTERHNLPDVLVIGLLRPHRCSRSDAI